MIYRDVKHLKNILFFIFEVLDPDCSHNWKCNFPMHNEPSCPSVGQLVPKGLEVTLPLHQSEHLFSMTNI